MTTSTQKIPIGYKQTELGVIPEDWDVKKMGDVADITKLAGFEYTKYFNSYKDGGEIIVIRGTNITQNKIDLTDVRTIPRSTSNKLPRSKLSKSDLVFAYVGTIGPVFLVDKDDAYHLGPNTCKLTAQDCISPEFIFTYFTSWLTQNEIVEHTSIGAQPSLSMTKIRRFRIICPPAKAEQTAIATVFSDTDTLIERLEKLIAKKKAIKQGAMQQLLTGKKRLLGFSGEWEARKLGDVCEIKTGKKDVNQGNPNGVYPFFTCSRESTYSDEYSFDGEAILIAGNGEVGNLHYFVGKFEAYQRTYVLQNFTVGTIFLWYQMRAFFKKSLGIGTIGSSIPYIKMENISEFIFSTPKDGPEQTAIATVLSDMDTEIQNLEKKRDKYTMLKQGMMQQLLTGKIRIYANN